MAVRGDLSPVSDYLSEYATGPGWYVARAGFLCLALASAFVAAGYRRTVRDGKGRAGMLLLWAWSAFALAAVLFPADPGGGTVTLTGTVHAAASLAGFLSLFIAMILLSGRARAYGGGKASYAVFRGLSFSAPAAFVLEAAYFVPAGLAGVGQWLLFGTVWAWLWLAAKRAGEPGAYARAPRR